ncbi:3-keto-disaccharide hydrolase [Bremerella volcania]|nr:DUF1080 domain-containing protein [Bremerella volcania]
MAFTLIVSGGSLQAADWQVLFDGTSLEGWTRSQDNDQFALEDSLIVGSSSGQTRFLYTEKEFADFELEFDVMLHDTDFNSGVQIRTSLSRLNDKGESRFSVHGPQVDLGKSPGRSGYIYGQGNRGWFTPKEALKSHDLMKNGQWNKVRVLAVGPRIQTWINGEIVSDLVNQEAYKKYPRGVVALQVHGVKNPEEKVRHVSFRNIRIREVKQ